MMALNIGAAIHSRRLPWPDGAPVLDLKEIVVLHFQYVVWERMLSKQRWYQAWEHVNHPQRRPLEIFRQYNHMFGSWAEHEIYPIKPEWLEAYDRAGVDFRSLQCEPLTWWDKELVQMFREYGPQHFRKYAVWDKDWTNLAGVLDVNAQLLDPRSPAEKWIHRMLATSQKHRGSLPVRALEKLLRKMGW